MRLRTSTPRRVAAAGIAVATAAALAACSSDSGENPDTGATGGSETSVEVSDETPTTPLDQVLLAKGEAPGNGVVDKLDPAALKAAVDQLVKDQGRKLMDEAREVDRAHAHSRTDTIVCPYPRSTGKLLIIL